MTFQPRPPLFVFGRASDDVFVADTVAAAVQHLNAHLSGDDDPADFEVFDFDGTPLALEGDTLGALPPWQYLQGRMQGLARRLHSDPGSTEPSAANLTLVKELGDTDPTRFAELAAELAHRTAAGPFGAIPDADSPSGTRLVGHPHPGSFGHNLCHRMHLCD